MRSYMKTKGSLNTAKLGVHAEIGSVVWLSGMTFKQNENIFEKSLLHGLQTLCHVLLLVSFEIQSAFSMVSLLLAFIKTGVIARIVPGHHKAFQVLILNCGFC